MRHTPPEILELVPIDLGDRDLLAWLATELEPVFRVRCRLGRAFAPRPEWLDPASGRCRADALLDSLLGWDEARGAVTGRRWLLGVTGRDLGAGARPFVFGEAAVGGGCAVVSTARLRSATDDQPLDEALFRTRLFKEAVHELGHAAGLTHCTEPTCVMFPSPGLDATDRKLGEFCARCASRLGAPAPEWP